MQYKRDENVLYFSFFVTLFVNCKEEKRDAIKYAKDVEVKKLSRPFLAWYIGYVIQ